ncbi:hypothetical protein EDD18DRAFT_1108040 [Armillaria luteobubalina]|uniref:Uncharacterized protein n=1 Tax=Armillaria luteobubalina TaxID=153913 RepID=A0AA39PZ41_9AGAR|nr:hypothetical protein EDD18DRAFT_1108040 [Armillaria luteobubalina]
MRPIETLIERDIWHYGFMTSSSLWVRADSWESKTSDCIVALISLINILFMEISAMIEQLRNHNFTHATGFGSQEEEYLCKNAISFHLYEMKHTFFANVALDFIYQDFVLYWPPEDHSKGGLLRLREHIRHALWWLFHSLDPEVREQQSKLTPQIYPPGPLEN